MRRLPLLHSLVRLLRTLPHESGHDACCHPPAERVRVFVRIRPTKAEGETPGALRVKADGRGVVVYRE